MKALARTTEKDTWSSTDYAVSISDVTSVGTMYVVGAGTHGAALDLAEIDDDGVIHTLTASIGEPPQVSTDASGRV